MPFKQFLMQQYNMDIATFKRKPDEVKAAISEEYTKLYGEEKSRTDYFRRVSHARRDRKRKSDRANKEKRTSLFVDDFVDYTE